MSLRALVFFEALAERVRMAYTIEGRAPSRLELVQLADAARAAGLLFVSEVLRQLAQLRE